ncbi:MAG: acyl-CoA desaturase [Thermoplasmatota archaeon]
MEEPHSSNTRAMLWVKNSIILAAVVIPLLATIYAVSTLWGTRFVSPRDLILLVSLYAISGLGVTIGFHRMLTHRGFDAPGWLRFIFLAAGSMALEGPAVEWASTHYKHHAKADQEGDPHSPVEGFWTAHVGWLFRDRFVTEGVYTKPFEGDKVAHFVNKTFFVWAVLGFVIPFWIGGWTGLLWGGLVRVFLLHHVTWSVNSVCHTFGKRPFETKDRSHNEWLVGLLGFGEGWHNNHHHSPQTAFHGLHWWQFDLSAYIIRGLEAVGLVWDVKRPVQKSRAPSPGVVLTTSMK